MKYDILTIIYQNKHNNEGIKKIKIAKNIKTFCVKNEVIQRFITPYIKCTQKG